MCTIAPQSVQDMTPCALTLTTAVVIAGVIIVMLTAKTGSDTGRCSGLYLPGPRGRHILTDECMIDR